MLNINPDGKKMILALDGGGARGTITAAMLAELEQMTGKPAYELFDMVAGTSSGAVIAAGLALHISAEDMLKTVFKEKLPPVFQARGLFFWPRFLLGGMRHLYDSKPFIDALRPLAGDKKIRDLQAPIVFMTTKDLRTSSTYYVVSAGPGAAAFADWPVAGAVAASAAAPILLSPIAGNLVDGAVGTYNNPCLVAVIEALEYIGFAQDNTRMLSVGAGYVPTNVREGGGARYWLKDWIEYLILEGFDDAALQQVYITRKQYPQLDFRRYNPLLTRTSVEDKLGVLTGTVDPQKIGVDASRLEEIDLMERIGRAYARKIDWTQANVLPWDTVGGHSQPGFLPVDWSKTPFA